MKKTSIRLNTEHITAMVKALKSTKAFTVEKEIGTYIVTHTASGTEVLRSIRAGKADLWLTTHASNLFV